jgi:hypothetical protein
MKKYLGILLVSGLTLTLFSFQQQKPKEQPKKKKIVFKGKTFLAGGTYGNGTIPVEKFESLMKLPLVSIDTANVTHPVIEYTFTYAERGAYEDSTGKLRIMTDYFTANSDNGLLPQYYLNSLNGRIKYGDTVYYSEVISSYGDSASRYHSLPIKLILTEK